MRQPSSDHATTSPNILKHAPPPLAKDLADNRQASILRVYTAMPYEPIIDRTRPIEVNGMGTTLPAALNAAFTASFLPPLPIHELTSRTSCMHFPTRGSQSERTTTITWTSWSLDYTFYPQQDSSFATSTLVLTTPSSCARSATSTPTPIRSSAGEPPQNACTHAIHQNHREASTCLNQTQTSMSDSHACMPPPPL